ncbi:hypothetical protein GLOTRDRAFT_110074 [Gloeophyllum trabeum ATCC 11539]|uniref:Uncharacterized protein n=1 Tax=Gloeophyllum trabeum (strain ATCC 11539 / FP-39264 / Madison 617) TaxID=670483 RepID=S7QFK9_GLOTA|nr:uncharacterized protein GLOTRDRAFT_110074 [Gloeophyllum trabeum ATCC 11539]EPQ58212.1 hypothetical protein GLOTRDRAFT_110074 [Gloeophyllum trabeum ATCC 11539]
MTMGAQPPPLGFRQDIYAPELSAPFYAGRPPPLPAGAMRPNPPNAQQWNIQGGPADIRRFRSTPNQGGSYSDSESGQGVRRVPRTPAAARRPGSVAAVDPAAWARLVLDAANGNRI